MVTRKGTQKGQKDVQKQIKEQQAEDRRAARIDYETTAFMLKRPHSEAVYKGPFRVKDREAHKKLIDLALSRGLYVWHADIEIVEKGGKRVRQAVGVHVIDWDSVPDHQTESTKAEPKAETKDEELQYDTEPQYPEDLKCRICGQQCSSKPGYTLHTKTHQDTVQDTADPAPELCCPICGKRCSSTSGLTLHKKTHE
jgi:hypothetical protein